MISFLIHDSICGQSCWIMYEFCWPYVNNSRYRFTADYQQQQHSVLCYVVMTHVMILSYDLTHINVYIIFSERHKVINAILIDGSQQCYEFQLICLFIMTKTSTFSAAVSKWRTEITAAKLKRIKRAMKIHQKSIPRIFVASID